MKVKLLVLIVAGALLSGGVAAYAHHSFASTYDEDESIEIEGEIVAFMFRNPHTFIHVMAPDENGEIHRWGVEWGGAGQLGRQGVTRRTLKPGDRVVITGTPSRNVENDHRMKMVTLHRGSDGFGWGQRPGEEFN